jgi:hypothetical protein
LIFVVLFSGAATSLVRQAPHSLAPLRHFHTLHGGVESALLLNLSRIVSLSPATFSYKGCNSYILFSMVSRRFMIAFTASSIVIHESVVNRELMAVEAEPESLDTKLSLIEDSLRLVGTIFLNYYLNEVCGCGPGPLRRDGVVVGDAVRRHSTNR